MSTNLNCPSCGIVTVVLIDAKVRTTGVACYCTKCDTERSNMIRAFANAGSQARSGQGLDSFKDVFGDIFGKGKF